MAERVGFEPTVRVAPTTVFETVPIDHSGTSPQDEAASRCTRGRSTGRALSPRIRPCQAAACPRRRIAYIERTMPRSEPLVSDHRAAARGPRVSRAAFSIGDVVRHRLFEFRGVIFDVDPVFANSEEWYQAIPEESAPGQGPAFLPSARRECGQQLHRLCQPAESAARRARRAGRPSRHRRLFEPFADGRYRLRRGLRH